MFEDFKSIIDRWPADPQSVPPRSRLAVFADDLGTTYANAKQMRRRNAVPSPYWVGLVQSAVRRKIDGVTLEVLAGLEAKKSQRAQMLLAS